MMRGIPAPRAKQGYIMMDAAREARFYGVPFGRFVDPFGDAVL
jgi:2-hydroxychromene-2-carboxylate isomerase